MYRFKRKKSSRQFIVEHWNMSSARQKFWFQIRRFERGWERKKKGVVLKYSYRLPCDVDRGSTGTDNTAVDSIFEFKEPARGLGWTCPHIPLLSLFFIERHIVERFNVRMVHAGFSMFRPKWWKVVINFIFITFDRSDSNTRVLTRKLLSVKLTGDTFSRDVSQTDGTCMVRWMIETKFWLYFIFFWNN